MAHYAASKAGINGFIRAAALEFAPLGITINGIEPGHVMTEGAAPGYDKGFLKAVEAFIPLGHLAEPDDIAEIDFLNGIIVRRGAELGIPVPANRAVYAMVKFVEGRMQLPAVDSHSR
jgi:NAD(P)-dependent dehydrogenase (short-subunit alcohol dehydrogenase family)